MTTLIFGILIGALLVLTVENTIKLHMKEKPRQKTKEEQDKEEEEKRDAENWQRVMDFHGRNKE